jgi:DNA-binding LacI/PurR family transcriptional regulator
MGVERQQGYTKALLDHGLPVDDSLIRSGDSPKDIGGYQATMELLALDPAPTAIFASNNVRTIGALQAIQEARLCIPEQLSVVGFDDSPWLSLLNPPLTTVCQPTYDIGAQAAGLLLRRLQDGYQGPPKIVELQPELIVRSSTAPLS